MAPRVSVVIATYRRPLLLRRCLRALARQSLSPQEFEVIVADDDANVRLEAFLRRFAARLPYTLTYVPVHSSQGPAGARNLGLAQAHAPIVAFTDDDTVPDRDWLANGLAGFTDNVIAAWGRIRVPLPARPSDHDLMVAGLETAGFVTANAFCRRKTLERIGGFDPAFTHAWREDSDLYFRLLDEAESWADRVVYLAHAVVEHPPRPARWGISLKQQANNYFNALLFKKHPCRYRAFIQRYPPLHYYVIVGATLGLLAGAALTSVKIATMSLLIWFVMTSWFVLRRLARTRRDARHLWEMILTSVLIPPLAIYWRLRGAFRWRVIFL